MLTHHRPYDSARGDFERIWKFMVRHYADQQDHFTWLVSRFGDWKYGLWSSQKHFPMYHRNNAELWVDEFDDLKGLAICENGDNNFTVFHKSGYGLLDGGILDWVIAQWGTRSATLKTEVHEYQQDFLPVLAARSFTCRGGIGGQYQYALRDELQRDIRLPAGYRIVDMSENGDYIGKRRLQVNAFRNLNDVSETDLLDYEYSRECPSYDATFDLSVITPDGMHVSSCVGFLDVENRIAEVERVCTHSEYRRKGLAEAVIRACFVRLKEVGIQFAYIQGYSEEASSLYARLGAVKEKRWMLYERESAPSA